jgi:hypothetical protein
MGRREGMGIGKGVSKKVWQGCDVLFEWCLKDVLKSWGCVLNDM